MQRIKRFLKRKFRREHILFAALLIVMVYIGASTLNVIAQNYQLQQRIDELRARNQVLELENQQLRYQITYYKTEAFVEKEARDKLGLQAPGETVVIFPDKVPDSAEAAESETEATLPETVMDNFQRWMYFLFRIKP
jgi:cell division protein FtsL